MSEKPLRLEGYGGGQTERAEQVLLEIWSRRGGCEGLRKHSRHADSGGTRTQGGIAGVAGSLRGAERRTPSFARALETLKRNFASPQHDGPARHAQFLGGSTDGAAQAYATVQEFIQLVNVPENLWG